MSDTFDHEADAWDSLMNEQDSYDEDDFYSGSGYSFYLKNKNKVIKCNKCGDTNVYWHQYPSGKWFIFNNATRQAHKCNPTITQTHDRPAPKHRIAAIQQKKKEQSIDEQYKNAKICPTCGDRAGFSFGTGDCGCGQ